MRNFRFLLASGILVFLFTDAASAFAQKLSADEQILFDSANRERAAQSLPALHWDEALAKAARKHANRMAFYNLVQHQLSGEPDLQARLTEAGARFGAIAENIAVASNARIIHSGWMDSPGHRRNILNPDLSAIGIAAVRGSGGLFAVQDFSQQVVAMSLGEQEKKVISLMTARGMHKVAASDDARKTCAMENGISVGEVRSVQAIRFEASNLSKLPDEVEKKLRGLAFQTAAVGACKTSSAPGFARYRIAILLF
jgi:Cysteine-rich secretory protein family